MYIYSYNQNSETAKNLARTMGIRRIKHEGSSFKGGPRKTVINYGSSNLPPEVMASCVINDPQRVARVTNKLHFFQDMTPIEGQPGEVPRIPPWTTSQDQVSEWIIEGGVVVARQVLQGHSGEGIVIMHRDNPDEYVQAPLYTKYVKKKDEYRVHIVNGEIIDFARKALRSDVPKESANFLIRNHSNGFVFVRGNVELPEDVRVQSLRCIALSGLDFGAVDVIYNQSQGQAYVLEINTAPGMEGTTLERYSDALARMEF